MSYDNQDYWSQNNSQGPRNTFSQQSYDFGSFDYSQQSNTGSGFGSDGQTSSLYPSATPISSPFGSGSGGSFGSGNNPQGNFDYQFGGEMSNMDDPYANEPPLLEELGINFEHIIQKTFCVLNPFRTPNPDIMLDADLAGPLVFGLAFGSLLLLTGKVHFSYIYGFGMLGCALIYFLLTLMSQENTAFSAVCAVSILGYCLLPMVFLSGIAVLVSLNTVLGMFLSLGAILWCSISASKLFVTALKMHNVQALVAYPCFLFYGVFALLALF